VRTPDDFVAAHGAELAQGLARDCFRAATDLCASLADGGALPEQVTVEGLFQVLLSFRATLELMAVEHRFGTPAHDRVLAAMESEYGRTVVAKGSFLTWIAAAHETMRRSENPRDWLRIHAENLLATRQGEHDVFHAALGYGLRVGPPLVESIEAGLAVTQED